MCGPQYPRRENLDLIDHSTDIGAQEREASIRTIDPYVTVVSFLSSFTIV